MLATVVIRKIVITGIDNGKNKYRSSISKKKEYYLDLTNEMIVFEGWIVPVTIPKYKPREFGDSCYTFYTAMPGDLKRLLVEKNINSKFDQWMNVYYKAEHSPDWNELFTDEELNLLSHEHKTTI